MTFDKQAIRFHGLSGAQVNVHWHLLNIFGAPRSAAWKRVRNFFRCLRNGFALESRVAALKRFGR